MLIKAVFGGIIAVIIGIVILGYSGESPEQTMEEIISLPVSFTPSPTILDENFRVEKIVSGLSSPTTMTFLEDDILVLQKNDGKVILVENDTGELKIIQDLSVNSASERGLLGITSSGNHVYIYLTESESDGSKPLGNRVYQYTWDGKSLNDKILIKDLPVLPGPNHDGGVLVTGSNGEIYTVIGDLNRNGALQNYDSDVVDDTSVILELVPDEKYYAIGIRNSFGLAIDPVNGNLWDTENGPQDFDEINLVMPKFNSGWEKIMGPASESDLESLPGFLDYTYSDPEFSWKSTVAPTGLSFIDSVYFAEYHNSLFVGDCNNGILYDFDLDSSRTGFTFENPELYDLVLDSGDSYGEIIFGTGFGCITDVEAGPDGLLYIVSISDGAIYQISPKVQQANSVESYCSGTARCYSGTVSEIIDGDTIRVGVQSIRFALASTPELHEMGGIGAKNFVASVCPVGSVAVIDEDDGQLEGSYGRILGVVHCNGYNLNQAVLDSGFGSISRNFCSTSEFGNHTWAVQYGC